MKLFGVAALFVLVACATATATTTTQDNDVVVMDGPVTTQALQPCHGECVCLAPSRPAAAVPVVVRSRSVVLVFGKTSLTPYCDVATQVQMNQGDGWTTMYNGPENSATVTQLSADTDYRFRIRERNCAAVGPFSDELQLKTSRENVNPDAPVQLSAAEHEICVTADATGFELANMFNATEDLLISFRKIAKDGSFSPSWEMCTSVLNGTAPTVVRACAENLVSGTFYQFRVHMTNVGLENPVSDFGLFHTTLQVPEPPTKPILIESQPRNLTIQWSRVPSKNNGSPPDIYFVDIAYLSKDAMTSNSTGNYSFTRVKQSTTTTTTVTGLAPGEGYAIRVTSVNRIGSSLPSPILMEHTKPDVPGPITGFNFTFVSSDTIRVAWDAAEPRGLPIIHYQLEKFGGAQEEFQSVYEGSNLRKRTENLEPNVYYGFRVRGVNARGPAEWSGVIFAKTPLPGEVLTDEELTKASVPISENNNNNNHNNNNHNNNNHNKLLALAQQQHDKQQQQPIRVAAVRPHQTAGGSEKLSAIGDQVLLAQPSNPSIDDLSGQAISDGRTGEKKQEENEQSVEGRCATSRGDRLEKDPNVKKMYFTCMKTIRKPWIKPIPSEECQLESVSSAVLEGSANSLSPVDAERLTKDSCGCRCSGEGPCPAGELKFYSGLSSAQECAQLICLENKFSICSYQNSMAAEGRWDDNTITFTSPALESCVNMSEAVACPNNCGGFERGSCVGNGTCVCRNGWSGPDCSIAQCEERLDSCGVHGFCVRPNECSCNNGYGGLDCDRYLTAHFTRNNNNNNTTVAAINLSALANLEAKRANRTVAGGPVADDVTSGIPPPPIRPRVLRRGQGSLKPKPSAGVSQNIAVPFFAARVDSLLSFTTSAWFRVAENDVKLDVNTILSHGDYRHGPGFGMGLLKGGHVFCAVGTTRTPNRISDIAVAVTAETFADFKFHHVSCVLTKPNKSNNTRANLSIFVDGNAVDLGEFWPYSGGAMRKFGQLDVSAMANLSPVSANHALVVGAAFDRSNGFSGDLSELRVWNVARKREAESQDMWRPMNGKGSFGLVVCLPLNDCGDGVGGVVGGTVAEADGQGLSLSVLKAPGSVWPSCVVAPHPIVENVGDETPSHSL